MGLKQWWDKKQEQWAVDAEKNNAKKEEKKRLRFDLEELLDQYEMKDLKDFCKNYLGTEPPTEREEDKKTGRFREIKPDRHTFVNFVLRYYDDGQLKANQIKDFSTKRKIVAKSFFGEESGAGDEGDFMKIVNAIDDEFDAEKCWDEQHLEDQLMIFLKTKFKNMKIERQQPARSGGRVDILIEGSIVLELKVPSSRDDLRNLGGQLEEYKDDFPYVCAVIADKHEVDEKHFKTYVEKYKSKYNVPSIVKDVIMR